MSPSPFDLCVRSVLFIRPHACTPLPTVEEKARGQWSNEEVSEILKQWFFLQGETLRELEWITKWKGDALHMHNNATDGWLCGERKATRFQRATNAGPCAKPERRCLSQGNTRVRRGKRTFGDGESRVTS